MPGPPPKPAAQRRRRNKTPAAVKLPSVIRVTEVPELVGDFGLEARSWWATVWSSPMASVYLEADVPALTRLASLIDQAAKGDVGANVLAEIRQLEDRFGLSPLARRRLQWEIEQAAPERGRGDRPDEDQRWLRAVSD